MRSSLITMTTTVFVHTATSGDQTAQTNIRNNICMNTRFSKIVCKQFKCTVFLLIFITDLVLMIWNDKNVSSLWLEVPETRLYILVCSLMISDSPTWWGGVVSPEDFWVSSVTHRATVRWPITGRHCDDRHSVVATMLPVYSNAVWRAGHVAFRRWPPADLKAPSPEVTHHTDQQGPAQPFTWQVDRRGQRCQHITLYPT